MPRLEIRLLGEFRAAEAGRLLELHAPRQQLLLAWLLLHAGAPQPRKRLAFAFWPDSGEAQALTNLRRELHHLRRALPGAERFLEITAHDLRWREDAPYELDVDRFEQALEAASRSEPEARLGCLEQAAALYRGELLPGAYEAWLEPLRERFHQQAAEALEALAGVLEDRGELERAAGVWQRLLALEPLRESLYLRLMRLQLSRGDRAAALEAYQRCARVLAEELGAAPGEAVARLYRQLTEAAAPPPEPADGLPLVGREAEWQRLSATWRGLERARALVIAGEAGIGKSRLADALLTLAEAEGARTARTRSYAAEGRLAYAPLGDWLRSPALAEGLARLEAPWLVEVARFVPEVLERHPGLGAPEPLGEGWQRQRLFEALARAVLAGGTPLVLLLDDVQWCDRDTLEWLHYLLRYAPGSRLLVVLTLRREEQGDNPALGALLRTLRQQGQLEQLELGPLERAASAALARSVLGRALDAEREAALYAATEGNPLFIVEALRAGLAANGEVALLARSPKVQAVVAARLGQLSAAARELAQLAATIGRAFDARVLREASGLPEEQLVAALDELWRRAVIRELPGIQDGYDFSHDRLREGAYDDLSPARRRLLHRRVAEALERLWPGDLARLSAELAAHHEQAGQLEPALGYYQQAAERANDLSASQEAIRLAQRALALLAALPQGAGLERRELGLLSALAAALSVLKGFTPPELEAVLNRAQQLAEKLGDEPALTRSLWGLYALHIVRGNVRLARKLAGEALSLAGDDSGLLTDCHHALGGVDLTEGRLAAAAEHFATALRLYRRHRNRRVLFGSDVGVFSLSWAAHGLWLQGEVARARAHVAQAEAIAERLGHPFTQAQASAYRTISRQLERDERLAWQSAEATVAGCERHNIAYYREWGVVVGGWAQALLGEPQAGAARIRRGLEALHQQDAQLRRPYYLALLAEVYLALGQSGEARALLDVAEVVARRNRDLWWLPEIARLRGLALTGPEAEASLRRALAAAREAGSRSLELRAAASLAAHLAVAGCGAEAAAPLASACAHFPDDLDTRDLREARALLATLG